MDDFILHVFPNVSAIRKTVRDAVEAYCFNYGLHEASLEPNLTEHYNSVSEINNIPEEASKILFLNDKELLTWRLQHELKIEDDRLYKYYKTHADLLMVASEIAKEKGLVEPEPEEVVSVPVTKDLYEKFADKAGQGDIDIINMIVWYDFEINRPTRTAYKVYIDALLCAYMMLIVNNGIVYQKNKYIKAVLSALSLISDAESRCPIDDIYDPSAESAVKRYQRKRGITANGSSILNGVQRMHNHGVLFLDTSPGNIFFEEPERGLDHNGKDGTAYFIDFGLSQIMDENNEYKPDHNSVTELTCSYAAPEMIANDVLTPATDLYSITALLLVLVAGKKSKPPAEPVVCTMPSRH